MSNVITPNMNLIEPGIGTEQSPTWAQDLNANFVTLDSHDHSSGGGVPITPAGMNISSDLSFGSNNATALRSARFTAQASPLALGTDIGCIYVSGVDLYYNDGSGNQVRITASGGVAGSPGSISGLVSPASATYTPGTGTFTWQSNSGVGANMDAATYILRYPGSYPTPSGNYIALQAPAALATGYALTLPVALPASQKFMTLDATGSVAAAWAVDGTTITVAANVVGVGTIPTGHFGSNIDFPGKSVRAGSLDVVVANTNPATNGLAIIRGVIQSNGLSASIVSGEGFTIVRSFPGTFTVTFTTAFLDTPAVTASSGGNTPVAVSQSISATQFTLETLNTSFGAADNLTQPCSFIAIGQRA